jgi:hypothetical protein
LRIDQRAIQIENQSAHRVRFVGGHETTILICLSCSPVANRRSARSLEKPVDGADFRRFWLA